jgi:hypothetical protein
MPKVLPERFESASIVDLTDREITEFHALDFLMGALRMRAPALLREVCPANGDVSAIREWAGRYQLECDLVIDFMAGQTRIWNHQPSLIAALDMQQMSGHDQYLVADLNQDREWVAEHLAEANLPHPFEESLESWRSRADKLYHSRAACWKGKRTRSPRWENLSRHCDWLVRMQALGLRPSEIGAQDGVEPAAVERETHRVADLMNIQRRRWPRSRPKKNV